MKIVSNGEREVGFTFEPAASELVTAVSRGSPYIANLLAHHAGQSALGADRVTVLAADVAASVDQTCMEFEGRIGKGTRSRLRHMMSNVRPRKRHLMSERPEGVVDYPDVQHFGCRTI